MLFLMNDLQPSKVGNGGWESALLLLSFAAFRQVHVHLLPKTLPSVQLAPFGSATFSVHAHGGFQHLLNSPLCANSPYHSARF